VKRYAVHPKKSQLKSTVVMLIAWNLVALGKKRNHVLQNVKETVVRKQSYSS
tara:strand:- start:1242 stop:1397 length:156 start_codon:yes stop_codon:yes gene_type:complete